MDRGRDRLTAQAGGCRPDSKEQTENPGEEENAEEAWGNGSLKKNNKTCR